MSDANAGYGRGNASVRLPRAASRRRTTGWTRHEIESLMRVSRAVALQSRLSDMLDVIAAEAQHVTLAKATSILLTEPGGQFHLVASKGLSRDYEHFLQSHFISHGLSLSRAAVTELRPVVVDDVLNDPRVNRPSAREWKRFALRENYHAVMSLPLIAGSENSGVLNVYRAERAPWQRSEIEVAEAFAQYAATAIYSAKLIDSQRRQLDALDRLVVVLRDQTHEYANRLQALTGMLSLGQAGEAEAFLQELMALHHKSHASVIERIQPPILAGLLIAQMSIARQRGVKLQLDPKSNVETLPPSLGAADAVSVVANLIENAVEAVAGVDETRRRATVTITQTPSEMVIIVRDWGPGVPNDAGELILARGRSSKEGHHGIGLALVSQAVAAVRGTLSVRSMRPGAEFSVHLPTNHLLENVTGSTDDTGTAGRRRSSPSRL